MAAADLSDPARPFRAATRASFPKSANRGNANAARIPSTTITMISSIRVKPLCCLFIVLSFLTGFKRPQSALMSTTPLTVS